MGRHGGLPHIEQPPQQRLTPRAEHPCRQPPPRPALQQAPQRPPRCLRPRPWPCAHTRRWTGPTAAERQPVGAHPCRPTRLPPACGLVQAATGRWLCDACSLPTTRGPYPPTTTTITHKPTCTDSHLLDVVVVVHNVVGIEHALVGGGMVEAALHLAQGHNVAAEGQGRGGARVGAPGSVWTRGGAARPTWMLSRAARRRWAAALSQRATGRQLTAGCPWRVVASRCGRRSRSEPRSPRRRLPRQTRQGRRPCCAAAPRPASARTRA